LKILVNIFLVLIIGTTAAVGQVSITAATGGTNIIRSKAVNGSSPAYTTLGNIVILETSDNDIKQSQTNNTLILSAPPNWQFNPAAGAVHATLGYDIENISMEVSPSTITITLKTANGNVRMNIIDEITISGIEVQAIDGNNTATTGDILQTSSASGTAKIKGIIDDVTSFGSLSLDPNSPMPVELISFSAELIGRAVYLNWATATEVNNYGFEIQRRSGHDNWEVIGFVEGHSNSFSHKNYEFIDDLSFPADYSQTDSLEYRLKQIDLDGTFEYYRSNAIVELRTITAIDEEVLKLKYELTQNYPNPFNPSTTISFNVADYTHVTLKVYDILGNLIETLVDDVRAPGNFQTRFTADHIPSGTYLLIMVAGDYRGLRKMMLIK
jgi:hypothetical protein